MATAKNAEDFWVCGRCGKEVFYQEEAMQTCPYCDYVHGTRDNFDVPEEVKLRIS